MYDLIIIGGGPAGVAASVYAARKRLKTLFLTVEFGGQSTVSETIFNWIGTPEIGGAELGSNLKKHAEYYKGEYLDIHEGYKVTKLEKVRNTIKATTEDGKNWEGKTALIASGSGRRKLQALNADVYENKGITYCASCDGPLFADQDVVVIGGGNAAFESAAQLLAYCKSVTLLHRSDSFKADEITVEKVLANSKMKAIKNVEVLEVKGDKFVNAIVYKDRTSGEITELPTTGIFVEIGQIPNTDFIKGTIELDAFGKIPVDPRTQMTKIPGIWSAGDCTDGKYHQNNIATGDAVKALEDLYIYIHQNS